MPRQDCEVVVVGGGIQGAGTAQAAAAAGFETLLLEQTEPAAGTSSRSSKLIHGGLRYLETGQWGLVRESLQERRILLQNAPDLVRLVPFFVPVYPESRRSPLTLRTGLCLYALLGGLRRENRFRSLPRDSWHELDGIRTQELRHVFQYFDAQTDDRMLTEAVIESARELGCRVACPAPLLSASRTADGYQLQYLQDGQVRETHCGVLVNAGGPWLNRILEKIDPTPQAYPMQLVQGAHVVIDSPVQSGVYYVEAPTDGRPVLIMPWYGRTMIGTTETAGGDDPSNPKATESEVTYLLDTFSHYFPDHPLDVFETFAGYRVLPKAEGGLQQRSRETTLWWDEAVAPRFVSIAGGKLTAYRATAAKVIQKIRGWLPQRPPIADTKNLPLRAVTTQGPSARPASSSPESSPTGP